MTITVGQISVQPVIIRTTASLRSVLAGMKSQRYTGSIPAAGWGNIFDQSDDYNNQFRSDRPLAGIPELLSETAAYPAQIRARYYWDDPDANTQAWTSLAPYQKHRLRMSDGLIAETGVDGELLGLLAERAADRLKAGILTGIRAALPADLRAQARFDLDADPLGLDASDLYLWLHYRVNTDPQITPDLTLRLMRHLRCEDVRGRVTVFKDQADFHRNALKAHVEDSATVYGETKISLRAETLGLNVDLELNPDGTFAVFRSGSHYDRDKQVSRETEGSRLLQDVAFSVIPAIVNAHRRDVAWTGGGRTAFMRAARDELTNRHGRDRP